MADSKNKTFLPGITVLSLSTILLGLVVVGFSIQIGNVHAGAAFMIGGLFALPLRPIMFVVPLVLLSGLVLHLYRRELYTRAELVCILFALLVMPPIMTEGFYANVIGCIVTIPQTSDMTKLDAYSEKMWPHGDNLLQGSLDPEAAGDGMRAFGRVAWEDMEVDRGRQQSVPVLSNEGEDEVSRLEISIPVFGEEQLQLFLNEPYLVTVLARAEGLGAESRYYCRIRYDDQQQASAEVFSSRETGDPNYQRPGGFLRKGQYGVQFSPETRRQVVLEFGLTGRGRVAFADPVLMSVSVINELYEGRKVMTEQQLESLPETLRGRVLTKPDSMISPAGIRMVLKGGIPLGEWRDPAIFWGGFLMLLLSGTFAIAVIMRRQWMENERYPMPMAQIPIRLLGLEVRDADPVSRGPLPAIWTNRLMWAGFGVTLFWALMKIWAAYNASVPNLSINVSFSPYFSDPSWGSMWDGVNFKVCSIFLALGLFMELNILLTIVVGYFLFRAQYWFGHAYGLTTISGYPFPPEQGAAAYVVYGLLVLVLARKYLWGVLRQALRGGQVDADEPEALSYRGCLAWLLLCYVGVAVWASWAGLGVAGMLVFYTIMLVIALVAAKLRAECGVPFSTYFPWSILVLVPLLGGTPLIVPAGFLFIAIMTDLLVIRSFLLLPGIQLELIELGRRARVRPRHLVATAVLGLVGAFVIGGWFTLSNSYTTGIGEASSINRTHIFGSYGSYMNAADVADVTTPEGEGAVSGGAVLRPETWAAAFGAVSVGAVTLLRQLFAGFWFHPIGILVAPSWMAQEAWGSLFLAWLIRFTVLKMGGASSVRNKLLPFAVGIFLGGTAAYLFYFVTVSYLKFFVPGVKNVWWSIWAL